MSSYADESRLSRSGILGIKSPSVVARRDASRARRMRSLRRAPGTSRRSALGKLDSACRGPFGFGQAESTVIAPPMIGGTWSPDYGRPYRAKILPHGLLG